MSNWLETIEKQAREKKKDEYVKACQKEYQAEVEGQLIDEKMERDLNE